MSDDNKDGNDDQKKLTDDPAFKEMQNAVKGIALLVQQGQQANTTMQENFTKLMEKVSEPSKKEDPEPDPDDINELDNVGLIKLVVGEVGKVVDDKLEAVGDSITATKQGLIDTRLEGEVKELMIENPDLLDWKSEMALISKDNPNLSLARLHSMARTEDPEKATELDEKYTESDDDKEDKTKGYLSLMPTSGGFEDADSDEKPMTSEEAADKAWEETLEDFPALGSMGDA